jgi:hypothetical protein
MKFSKRASQSDKNSSIFAKINDFITLNSFALFLLVLGVWLHQIFVVGATVKELESNQYKMVKYLQENVNKIYFLSASGMAITATKSEVSYSDERFKSYIVNEIVDKLVAGNIVLSSNYKITYASANDLVIKNHRINDFYGRFIKPDGSVLAAYARALHRAIVDGKYPEYINVLSQSYEKFVVRKPTEESQFKTKIDATLKLTLLVKSWIRDLKKWDTREVEIRVPFIAVIDVERYVNIGNPFGVHFEKLDLPIIHKPTATQIMEGKI